MSVASLKLLAMRRHAKKAWFFRARLPDGLNLGNNPWSFKSGITASPAKSQASRKTSKARAPARTTWGAQGGPILAAEPSSDDLAPEQLGLDDGAAPAEADAQGCAEQGLSVAGASPEKKRPKKEDSLTD